MNISKEQGFSAKSFEILTILGVWGIDWRGCRGSWSLKVIRSPCDLHRHIEVVTSYGLYFPSEHMRLLEGGGSLSEGGERKGHMAKKSKNNFYLKID